MSPTAPIKAHSEKRRHANSTGRVAVIGAGLTGVVTALILADAGFQVDLFEQNKAPFLGASGTNEGKIHLGYVYAMDDSLQTTRMMQRGAARFRQVLERWIDPMIFKQNCSAPFVYAVPKTTMQAPERIKAHFARVFDENKSHAGQTLNKELEPPRELCASTFNDNFDPQHVLTAFQTDEIAIDVAAIAQALAAVVSSAPEIAPRYSCEVGSIRDLHGRYCVAGHDTDGPFADTYDAVVNAAWQNRLKLDRTFGIEETRPVFHRYKCGIRTRNAITRRVLPSVTFVVGEYGDMVAYQEHAYASWYPAGLLSQETRLAPSAVAPLLDPNQQRDLIGATLAGLRKLAPGAAPAFDSDPADWAVVGGYISAWGATGIHDKQSELHERYDVGVHSVGNYHSVDTGKYTLAPMLAEEVAARILTKASILP